jgi:Tfp pilus assembly protein PilO
VGNLTEKQLFIIVIVVAILVSGAFGVLSFLEFQKIEEKREQIQNVQTEIDKYRAKEREIHLIEAELTTMRSRNIENKKALPEWKFDDALLKGIQAQATTAKVKITSWEIPPERVGRQRQTTPEKWESFRIELKLEGFYFDLLNFINLIEHYPRYLSVKDGKFKVTTSVRRAKPKTPTKEDEKTGPLIGTSVSIEAYMLKKAPVAPPRPVRPATGKAGKAGKAGAPAAKGTAKAPPRRPPTPAPKPKPIRPPEGEVFKEIQIPEEDQIKVDNRRNPFIIWLEPKKVEEDDGKDGAEEEVPKEAKEIEKLITSWKERLNKITVMQAQRDKPKETYFEWKNLVREVTRKKLQHPYSAKREEILQSLLAEGFRGQILAAYDGHLEEVARKYRMRMEDARNVGMPNEVCTAFKEFLAELLSGDRLPTRVRREFKACMDIFLDVMRTLVEEEGEYEMVLTNLKEIKKTITNEWKEKPFIKDFLDKAEEYHKKAQALVEFFNMNLLVSGMFWLPDNAKSKRVAIVNDKAVLEGETVPIEQKRGVRLPPEGAAPVSLEEVGNDRYVWFGYKGLKIKYPLGKQPKKKKKPGRK